MGRDLRFASSDALRMAFRSTRPHGARRGAMRLTIADRRVSIHAPAWGATIDAMLWRSDIDGFDPRARMGRDRRRRARTRRIEHVSIHAPAWGATRVRHLVATTADSFDPRARMGRDRRDARSIVALGGFDPRARMGRDACAPATRRDLACFDPRARMGRDTRIEGWTCRHREVSIHAPAWGATRRHDGDDVIGATVSIHAPAWGATMAIFADRSLISGFDPRARMGRDRRRVSERDPIDGFDPRARMGRDVAARVCSIVRSKRFDPRARMGRDATRSSIAARNGGVSIHAPAWGATPSHARDVVQRSGFRSTRPHGARP